MTSPEWLREFRRLALACDVETATDPAELTRRSVESHMRSVAMENTCGAVGRAGVACVRSPGHELPHDWSGMNNPDQRSELADDDRRAIADTYARYRDAIAVAAFVPWRVGRTNACNVYAVTGIAANWKDDAPIACFTVPELAIQACDDHNHRLDTRAVR